MPIMPTPPAGKSPHQGAYAHAWAALYFSDGTVHKAILSFSYDLSDVLAVRMRIASATDPNMPPETWYFARQVLGDLVRYGAGGDSDVTASQRGNAYVISLRNGIDAADIILDRFSIVRFLAETELLCPPGGPLEQLIVGERLDLALRDLVGGSA